MKAVLLSIKPKYCELIANKKKTIEIRKTEPKLRTPFKCYIYCTNTGRNLVLGDRFDGNSFITEYAVVSGYSRERANEIWGVMNGKVIGEFICDEIYYLDGDSVGYFVKKNGKYVYLSECAELNTCISEKEIKEYLGIYCGYGWHISELKIYDEPKELREFCCPAEKYCDKGLCDGCPYDEMPILKSYGDVYDYDCGGERPLKRPPRSWYYVEELK